MAERLNYYILFETYTQGMALKGLLDKADVPCRISPAPRSIQGELGCGMSILLEEEDIGRARECIEEHKAVYYDIVPLPCQIDAKRNRFC